MWGGPRLASQVQRSLRSRNVRSIPVNCFFLKFEFSFTDGLHWILTGVLGRMGVTKMKCRAGAVSRGSVFLQRTQLPAPTSGNSQAPVTPEDPVLSSDHGRPLRA